MSNNTTDQPNIWNRLFGVGAVCVLVAVSIRLMWFLSVRTEPFFYAHVQDSALYHEMAISILASGFPFDGAFVVAPLYGLFLAGIYRIFGADPTAVYLIQVGFSALTVLLTVDLGRQLFGRWGAWCGGLVAALFPVSVIYDVRLLSVGLATLLTVGAAWVGHRAWVKGRGRDWFLSGLVFGVSALARGNMVLLAPVLACIAFWRGRFKHAAVCMLGFGLGIGPATVHNYAASGEVVPISLGGGINLYRGNNAHVVDSALHPFRLPPERDGLIKKSRLIASIETDTPMTPAQADRFWAVRSILHWVDDPVRAVGLTLRKLVQSLSPTEIGEHLDLETAIRTSPVLKWIPPMYGPVVVLGLLGLLGTRRARDAVPAAVVGIGLLSVALFFVVSRYRTPFVPLIAVYAGGGLLWMKAALIARGRGPLWAGGVLVVLVTISMLSPPLHPALPWNAMAGEAKPAAECAVDQHVRHDSNLEAQFQVGVFALNHGRWPEAEEAMWAVLKADSTHTPAGVNLSWLLLQKGANEPAAQIARKVIAVDPCDDKAWANLATASMRLGDKVTSFEAAQRAAQIDPYNPGYWSSFGESLLSRGERKRARILFERAVKWRPDMWQPHARLGQMALEDGQYAEASTHLQVAVTAQPNRVELIGMLGLSEIGRGNQAGARRLLNAAVKSNLRGPAITALARALAIPNGEQQ